MIADRYWFDEAGHSGLNNRMISALLLAAGESRRMGSFKQLLIFEGKTFVERCADELLASAVGEVIVVTGHREADVRRAVGGRPVRFAHNADYKLGMSYSLKRGLAAVTDGADAVLIALVDQPQITTAIFDEVIDTYRNHRPLLVVPSYAGRNGHPIIVDMKLREEVLAMDPEQGLRRVVRAHAGDTIHVEVGTDLILKDFDYPEDYRRE